MPKINPGADGCGSVGRGQGLRITLITPGSPLWRRSNQPGPWSSGAMALMKGGTSIWPRDIISRHAGDSPLEAQEPRRLSSALAAGWGGILTLGEKVADKMGRAPF